MAKLLKIEFITAIPACKFPKGLEINVTTSGSIPNGTEVKKGLRECFK